MWELNIGSSPFLTCSASISMSGWIQSARSFLGQWSVCRPMVTG